MVLIVNFNTIVTTLFLQFLIILVWIFGINYKLSKIRVALYVQNTLLFYYSIKCFHQYYLLFILHLNAGNFNFDRSFLKFKNLIVVKLIFFLLFVISWLTMRSSPVTSSHCHKISSLSNEHIEALNS